MSTQIVVTATTAFTKTKTCKDNKKTKTSLVHQTYADVHPNCTGRDEHDEQVDDNYKGQQRGRNDKNNCLDHHVHVHCGSQEEVVAAAAAAEEEKRKSRARGESYEPRHQASTSKTTLSFTKAINTASQHTNAKMDEQTKKTIS